MANRIVQTIYDLKDLATAKLRKISGGFGDNANKAEEAGRRIDNANKRTSTSLERFSRGVARVRFAFLGVVAVIGGFVAGMLKAAKAADEQARVEAQLEATLRRTTGATEEQIQALKDQAAALQQTTRFGDEATISAQALLATFALNAEEIQKLTPLLQDTVEANRKLGQENVSLESTALAVGKAFTSGIGALTRYGVAVNDSQKAAFAAGDQAEKLSIILQALEENFGGAAAVAGQTFGGQLERAKNAAGDFVEGIGRLITESEAFGKVVSDISGLFTRLTESIDSGSGTVKRSVEGIGSTIRILGATFRVVFNGITIVFEAAVLSLVKTSRVATEALEAIVPGDLGERFRRQVETFKAIERDLVSSIETDTADIQDAFGTLGDAGRDLTEAVQGYDEASKQAFASARKAADEQRAAQEALEKAQRDTIQATDDLRTSLEALGVSAENIKNLAGDVGNSLADEFRKLANNPQTNGEILVLAIESALQQIETPDELRAFENAVRQAFAAGKIGADDYVVALQRIRSVSIEVNDTQEGLQKALEETQRKLTDTLASGAEGAAKKAEELAAEINRLRDELAKLGDGAGEAAETVDRTADSLDTATKKAEELGRQGPLVGELFESGLRTVEETADSTTGAVQEAIASVINSVATLSEGTTARVNDLLEDITVKGKSVALFFRDLARGLNDIRAEFEEQTATVDALFEAYEEGRITLAGLAIQAQSFKDSLDLTDQARLDNLLSAIDQAGDAFEALEDKAQSALQRIQEELLQAQGRTDELEELRANRKIAELEQLIEEARQSSSKEARELIAQLQQGIENQRQLLELSRQEDEARTGGKEKEEDVNASLREQLELRRQNTDEIRIQNELGAATGGITPGPSPTIGDAVNNSITININDANLSDPETKRRIAEDLEKELERLRRLRQ